VGGVSKLESHLCRCLGALADQFDYGQNYASHVDRLPMLFGRTAEGLELARDSRNALGSAADGIEVAPRLFRESAEIVQRWVGS